MRKLHMAVAAILVIASVPAVAVDDSTAWCVSLSELIEAAGKARDRGVKKEVVFDVLEKSDSLMIQTMNSNLKKSITTVYDAPALTPQMASAAYLQGCIKGMK